MVQKLIFALVGTWGIQALAFDLTPYADLEFERRKTPLTIAYFYSTLTHQCADAKSVSGRNKGHLGECGDNTNAILLKSDFTKKNLRGADFREANLKESDFTFADLRGANFAYSNTRDVIWKSALYSDKTILPFSDAEAQRQGMVFIDQLEVDKILADFPRSLRRDVRNAFLLGGDIAKYAPTIIAEGLKESFDYRPRDCLRGMLESGVVSAGFKIGNVTLADLIMANWPTKASEENLRLDLIALLGYPPSIAAAAIRLGKRNVFDMILRNNSSPPKCALSEWAKTNLPNDWAEDLLKVGADIHEVCDDNTALGWAARNKRTAHVDWLLFQKADPNDCAGNCSVLAAALLGQDIDIVDKMLKAGANAAWNSPQGDSLLSLAWNLQSAEMLFKAGAQMTGVKLGKLVAPEFSLVEFLLGKGADPNATDLEGNTLLIKVAAPWKFAITVDDQVRESVAILLLKSGADATHKNAKNQTSLSLIIDDPNSRWEADSNIAVALLDKGADPNSLGSDSGKSVLEYSVVNPFFEKVFHSALAHGASPNTKSRDGKTALYRVILGGFWNVYGKKLVQAGADIQFFLKETVSKGRYDYLKYGTDSTPVYLNMPAWMWVLAFDNRAFSEASQFLITPTTNLAVADGHTRNSLWYIVRGLKEGLADENWLKVLERLVSEKFYDSWMLAEALEKVGERPCTDDLGTRTITSLFKLVEEKHALENLSYIFRARGADFACKWDRYEKAKTVLPTVRSGMSEEYFTRMSAALLYGVGMSPALYKENAEGLYRLFQDLQTFQPGFLKPRTKEEGWVPEVGFLLPVVATTVNKKFVDELKKLGFTYAKEFLSETKDPKYFPTPVDACQAFGKRAGFKPASGGCLSAAGKLWSKPTKAQVLLRYWNRDLVYEFKNSCPYGWRVPFVGELFDEFSGVTTAPKARYVGQFYNADYRSPVSGSHEVLDPGTKPRSTFVPYPFAITKNWLVTISSEDATIDFVEISTTKGREEVEVDLICIAK